MTVETLRTRARLPHLRASSAAAGSWPAAMARSSASAPSPIWRAFVDAGVTTFDCADIYTGVEEMYRRVPRRRCAQARGLRAAAGAHQVRARPRDLATRRRGHVRAHHRPLAAAPAAGAARPRAVPLVGLRHAAAGSRPRSALAARCARRARSRHVGGTNFDTPHTRGDARCRRAAGHHAGAVFAARPAAGRRRWPRSARAAACSCSATARSPAGSSPSAGSAQPEPRSRFDEPLAGQVQADHRGVRRLGRRSRRCCALLDGIARRHGVSIATRRDALGARPAGMSPAPSSARATPTHLATTSPSSRLRLDAGDQRRHRRRPRAAPRPAGRFLRARARPHRPARHAS